MRAILFVQGGTDNEQEWKDYVSERWPDIDLLILDTPGETRFQIISDFQLNESE